MASDHRATGIRRIALWSAVFLGIAFAVVLGTTRFFRMSGSMQPTILGSPDVGMQDRLIASALPFWFQEPARWDVVQFEFPLCRSMAYVSRLIGMPGDHLRIEGGDVLLVHGSGAAVDFEVLRKPDAVRESLLREVFPGPDESPLPDFFECTAPGGGETAARITEDQRVEVDEGGVRLTTRRAIKDGYRDGYPRHDKGHFPRGTSTVNDLGVGFTWRAAEGDGRLVVTLREGTQRHVAEIPQTGGGSLRTLGDGDMELVRADLARAAWGAREEHSIRFLNVDDQLRLELDGVPVATLDVPRLPEVIPVQNGVEIVAEGPGQLGEVRVVRDIYYIGGFGPGVREFQIPEDHHLVLGDNVQNSHDSRFWEAVTVKDGSGNLVTGHHFPVHGSPNANPRQVGGNMVLVDTEGVPHVLAPSAKLTTESRPFVHRGDIRRKVIAVAGERRALVH